MRSSLWMSAPKRLFIFYNSFYLRLTENLYEQKHFLKHDLHVLFISFFSKMYNKKIIYPRLLFLTNICVDSTGKILKN